MYDERFAKIVLEEVQNLFAEIRAIKYVMKPALVALLENAEVRNLYEEHFGLVKATLRTMPPGETHEEKVAFKAMTSAERLLSDLSALLEEPLRPKAVLGTVRQDQP